MDSNTTNVGARGKVRWRPLVIVALVGVALVAFCQLNPWFDNAVRTLSTFIAYLLIGFGVYSWFVFCTGRSRTMRRLLIAVAVVAVGGFVAVMRARYDGDLNMTYVPRNWVLNLARRAGVNVGDVIHKARLAEPPLNIVPTAADSPKFFGPAGDGVISTSRLQLSRDWAQSPPREVWRKPVGLGWSSFSVVGDYGFTQEATTDMLYEQVTCYDLRDGSVQWAHGDAGVFDSGMGGTGPRATPTFYEGKLVTIGARGLLNCFDAATGRRLWSRDPVSDSAATIPDWGMAGSPLVFRSQQHGDLVVMSVGGSGGKSLQAFKLEDGAPVWSVGNDAPGYCSPELHTLGGVRQVVLVNWQSVTGHDPETGAELWRYDDWEGSQPKVPQPVVLDDRRVLISAGYGTGCVMLDVVRGDDGKWSAASKWKSNKLKPKFTSLVVRNDHAYGLDDGAFLMCLNLADGELKWRSRRGADYGHGQVLLLDDVLLVQAEKGDVALVAADPAEYRELTRFTALSRGEAWNVPVVAGRRLLVRSELEAACFELPVK